MDDFIFVLCCTKWLLQCPFYYTVSLNTAFQRLTPVSLCIKPLQNTPRFKMPLCLFLFITAKSLPTFALQNISWFFFFFFFFFWIFRIYLFAFKRNCWQRFTESGKIQPTLLKHVYSTEQNLLDAVTDRKSRASDSSKLTISITSFSPEYIKIKIPIKKLI